MSQVAMIFNNNKRTTMAFAGAQGCRERRWR